MGIDHGGRENGYIKRDSMPKRWRAFLACLCSFIVSMVGGVVLVYWQIKYHPQNRELWMVPFGLVVFATPLFVWFISFASDACCPRDQQQLSPDLSESTQLGPGSVTRPVHDPERL